MQDPHSHGRSFAPIHLLELPDGTILIPDGHHRSLAYWLSGREWLDYGEFIFFRVERSNRHPRGNLEELRRRVFA